MGFDQVGIPNLRICSWRVPTLDVFLSHPPAFPIPIPGIPDAGFGIRIKGRGAAQNIHTYSAYIHILNLYPLA